MKFDDLDARMRVFESANDPSILPGLYVVARLDGRGFTRLTKEVHSFEAPFDERMRDMMIGTTRHLMEGAGFRVAYGYTESDEISLLFHPEDASFGRRQRKLLSVLAGEASAMFTSLLGGVGCFDCRLSQLPTVELVVEYFRWRQEDAHRNALSSHCYWLLRREGASASQATAQLESRSAAEKNELLFTRGINFNDLPAWQKRGVGLVWEQVEHAGVDPRTGETTTTQRRRLSTVLELAKGDAYGEWLAGHVPAREP